MEVDDLIHDDYYFELSALATRVHSEDELDSTLNDEPSRAQLDMDQQRCEFGTIDCTGLSEGDQFEDPVPASASDETLLLPNMPEGIRIRKISDNTILAEIDLRASSPNRVALESVESFLSRLEAEHPDSPRAAAQTEAASAATPTVASTGDAFTGGREEVMYTAESGGVGSSLMSDPDVRRFSVSYSSPNVLNEIVSRSSSEASDGVASIAASALLLPERFKQWASEKLEFSVDPMAAVAAYMDLPTVDDLDDHPIEDGEQSEADPKLCGSDPYGKETRSGSQDSVWPFFLSEFSEGSQVLSDPHMRPKSSSECDSVGSSGAASDWAAAILSLPQSAIAGGSSKLRRLLNRFPGLPDVLSIVSIEDVLENALEEIEVNGPRGLYRREMSCPGGLSGEGQFHRHSLLSLDCDGDGNTALSLLESKLIAGCGDTAGLDDSDFCTDAETSEDDDGEEQTLWPTARKSAPADLRKRSLSSASLM